MFKLDKSMLIWNNIRPIPAGDLIKTREQLHHAVQFIAAAGKYLVKERPTSFRKDEPFSILNQKYNENFSLNYCHMNSE